MRLSAQLIGCVAVLAGTFAALILIAGSRDAQVVTGLLVVAAVALAVPYARRWVRQLRRANVENTLTDLASGLMPPSHQDSPQSARGVRDSQ